MTARIFGLRFSLSYALMMIGNGVQLPFLPLWLKAKGLDVNEIAAVVAGMMAVRIIGAPFFAGLADRTGNRLGVVRGCALAALVGYAALSVASGFVPILLSAMLAALFFAPVFPLIEGYSVEGSAAHGLDYGRLRLWASLSFLTGSLAAGAMLTKVSAVDAIYLVTGAQALSLASTFILPPDASIKHVIASASPELSQTALRFFVASPFTVFLVAACFSNASHAMLFSFSSVHWAFLGYSTLQIGILWACSIFGEVLLFAFSNRIVNRLGVSRLLCVGLSGGIVRWTMMAFVTDFYLSGALQMMHAISFACSHLALMHYIRLKVPQKLRNRAQALYTALGGGLMLSLFTWGSGPLYNQFGGKAYLAMALLSFTGLCVAVASWRSIPKVRFLAAE